MWILVWALVARFMSNGCSSLVHRFPITWSPRDRLEGMAGTVALLENLCAITLHKKYNRNYEMPKLYYYNQNIEVDFYVPEEGLAIQASFSLEDMDTRKREVAALIALNKVYPIRKAIIITYDEEEIIEEDGITIEVIPIWKWLTE